MTVFQTHDECFWRLRYEEFKFPSIASETKERDDPESVILASSPLDGFHFLTEIKAAVNDRPWIHEDIAHLCEVHTITFY